MAGSVGNVTRNKTLTEMAMAYSRSRVLCAAARLEIADALGDEERTVEELAQKCGADAGSLYRLLRALASFGVVIEKQPGRFALTPFGRPLRQGIPETEWAAIVFWGHLLAEPWSYLTECVRTGERAGTIMEREGVQSLWSKDPNARAIFGAVMGTGSSESYAPIARAWDFSKYRTISDLGGGGGALIAAVLETYPEVNGMLVDRAEFLESAAARFESVGLAGRCKLEAADLLAEVPAGADVYILKHVLHGYTDEVAVKLLKNCRSVLPAGGRLLVIEFVLPDVVDHADLELEGRLMSDLNMMAVTGGKERSAVEWKRLLGEAGFEFRGIIPVDLVSIIEAAPHVIVEEIRRGQT